MTPVQTRSDDGARTTVATPVGKAAPGSAFNNFQFAVSPVLHSDRMERPSRVGPW
jgi:hypothetical protein